MPKSLIHFLLFSNACVLTLYGIRWAHNYRELQADAILTGSVLPAFQAYCRSMPLALVFFLLAFVYLLIERFRFPTGEEPDVLDADEYQ
ncbi:MAG: hypothetical protein KDC12_08320 [Flavobacteriales bacterium]|nr:hypothetical protein [Flavobacteriales bacterium]